MTKVYLWLTLFLQDKSLVIKWHVGTCFVSVPFDHAESLLISCMAATMKYYLRLWNISLCRGLLFIEMRIGYEVLQYTYLS